MNQSRHDVLRRGRSSAVAALLYGLQRPDRLGDTNWDLISLMLGDRAARTGAEREAWALARLASLARGLAVFAGTQEAWLAELEQSALESILDERFGPVGGESQLDLEPALLPL